MSHHKRVSKISNKMETSPSHNNTIEYFIRRLLIALSPDFIPGPIQPESIVFKPILYHAILQ